MARLLAWSSLETEDTFAAIWYVLLVGEVREYAHSCSEVDLYTRMKAQALPITVEEEVDTDIACVLRVGELFLEPRALGIDEREQSFFTHKRSKSLPEVFWRCEYVAKIGTSRGKCIEMGECKEAYLAAFTSRVLKRPIIYDLEVGLDADASTSHTAPDKRIQVLLLQGKG